MTADTADMVRCYVCSSGLRERLSLKQPQTSQAYLLSKKIVASMMRYKHADPSKKHRAMELHCI